MSVSGVYQIVNMVNGHRYIGSTANLRARKSNHWHVLRTGKHENAHLQHAWNKYGEGMFEFRVIGTCHVDDLLRMEQHLLDNCIHEYNIALTAGAAMKGRPKSAETRAKISAAHKGKRHSAETRAKISAAHKGKPLSAEHRAKMSEAQRRRRHSAETRAKMSEARKDKPISAETRAKRAAAQKPRSAETRAKISAARKGKPWSKIRRAAYEKVHARAMITAPKETEKPRKEKAS